MRICILTQPLCTNYGGLLQTYALQVVLKRMGHEVWTENIKKMLDDMHKRKIDMADEIFVINKNGYIGSSTKSEIEYALKTNKKVNYME